MLFRLREATANDVPALAGLHVETFNETHTQGRGNGPTYAVAREAVAATPSPYEMEAGFASSSKARAANCWASRKAQGMTAACRAMPGS